ncbi:MAG: hypothetical protein QOD36_86 [Mycobacterium sp.]|nr:hypothetical protein [Mycobacterium sp.]
MLGVFDGGYGVALRPVDSVRASGRNLLALLELMECAADLDNILEQLGVRLIGRSAVPWRPADGLLSLTVELLDETCLALPAKGR